MYNVDEKTIEVTIPSNPRSSLFFEQPAVDTPTQAHTKCPISNINIDRPTPCEGFTFNDADNYLHTALSCTAISSARQGKAAIGGAVRLCIVVTPLLLLLQGELTTSATPRRMPRSIMMITSIV